jgi:glutaredoxin
MKVEVYTTAWCRDCRAAKQFLDANGIAYTEINVDSDPTASAEVMRHAGKRAVPQLVIDGQWFQPYKPGSTTSCANGWESLADKRLSLVQFRVSLQKPVAGSQ